jgi:DNA (cytosine-5)-methyltransferase 1
VKLQDSLPHDKPIVVDLFSGAGGLSEGFAQAGFFIALSVEKDAQAVATQVFNHSRWKKRYRTQVLNADVQDLDFTEIRQNLESAVGRPIDVVVGGPPCQGFSRSNMRTRHSSNPANALVAAFVTAVSKLNPRIAVMENVADIQRFEDGKFITGILSLFRSVGYDVECKVLNAATLGVPQIRRRMFFVAVRDGLKPAFPEPRVEAQDYVSVWDAISDLPELKVGHTIDEMPYGKQTGLSTYQVAMRQKANGKVRNNFVSRNSDLILQRYAHIPQGGNWRNIPDDLMKNYKDKNRCHQWIYRRLPEDQPCVVITHYRKSMLIHPRQDRGLSVREAARIQSFPDHFVFQGTIQSQQQQVANAVPPLLAKAVATRLRHLLGV